MGDHPPICGGSGPLRLRTAARPRGPLTPLTLAGRGCHPPGRGTMRRRRVLTVVLLGAAAGVTPACKRSPAPVAAVPDARPQTVAPNVELPTRGAGMDDPFARMTAESVKSLNAGYAALRAKKL